MIWLAAIAAVVVLVVAVFVTQQVRGARRNERRARRALAEAVPGRVALRWELAVGSGVQEPMRLRGEGVLALYDDALVFVRLGSREATRIPLADISDVTRMRAIESFLGSESGPGARARARRGRGSPRTMVAADQRREAQPTGGRYEDRGAGRRA